MAAVYRYGVGGSGGRSGCEVDEIVLLGLAYGKGVLRPGRSYLEGGERGKDVVSEGEARCYLRRSDAARRTGAHVRARG